MKLLLGDCKNKLKELEDNSIDSIVTDPPYGLSFMGKKWDYDVPQVEVWKECLRVLKPGGYLLSFAGTRTQHRMAVNIEDAGFEIRDMIAWVYGSGFPKSLNIGKAVDKINGETGRELKFVNWFRTTGLKQKETNEIIGKSDVGSHYLRLDQPAIPTRELWAILRPHIKVEIPGWVDELVERVEREREVVGTARLPDGHSFAGERYTNRNGSSIKDITKGTSEWEGWGTALKPALEPITVARKPLGEKSVAQNCLKWGVGGINIDGCRVETEELKPYKFGFQKGSFNDDGWKGKNVDELQPAPSGRFPANLIHDGSEEVVGLFPNNKSSDAVRKNSVGWGTNGIYGKGNAHDSYGYSDSGSAARFFYCAKASKRERNIGCEGLEEKIVNDGREKDIDNAYQRGITLRKNTHPTVKPVALMEYLVKLVSREGQVVLDPFMGSGTTGMACKKLGRDFVGIEMEEEYIEIAKARIEGTDRDKPKEQLNLV